MAQKMYYDVFISHASEDKEEIALPLAEALTKLGLRVWIDKMELLMGDSIRKRIDDGLSKSKFGVVILSKQFFRKDWSQKELNALFARENQNNKVILPVWHNISREDVLAYSPLLADRLAFRTTDGLQAVAREIYKVVTMQKFSKTSFPKTSADQIENRKDSKPGEQPTNDALEMANRVLAILERQAAAYTTIDIPASLVIQIEEKRKEIAEMKRRIKDE